MSRWRSLLPTCLVFASTASGAVGCAAAVESSRLEDKARRTVPVPICLNKLERKSGSVSAVKPEDYWKLILPSYDPGANTVDRSAPDCSGRPVFDKPELAQAEGARSGTLVVKPDDAIITPGPDELRIVWLRTHRFADGTAAGPLALARPREGYAEVYATGFYHGGEKDSRFALERMGSHFAVTAGDEGCLGVKPNRPCQSSFQVMLMATGKLVPSAKVSLDRIAYRSVPGVPGPVQARLTATPVFQPNALRVIEQLVLRDENQNVVRKSDLERVFQLKPGGRLVAKRDSLWEQLAQGSAAASPPPAPAEPADGEEPGKDKKKANPKAR